MVDERTSAEDLAALRAAVLGLHKEFLVPPPGRRTQRVVRRLHLSWLLVPWFVVAMARDLRGYLRGSMAVQARAFRLYGQLSGKDPHVARAEVFRIPEQLGSLDERHRWLGEDRSSWPTLSAFTGSATEPSTTIGTRSACIADADV